MKEKTVGIIGGMGPEATCDLMMRVIRATPAEDDADHIRMVVDNNPKVPSRIKALIEGTGESPVACLTDMAQKLAAWGADFLAIPCNTAHYYYEDIKKAVSIPVLDMIALTTAAVLSAQPKIRRVGLLASTAVHMTQLYEKRFAQRGVQLVCPDGDDQQALMAVIRQIKTCIYDEGPNTTLQRIARNLTAKNAEALIIACTELSVIGEGLDQGVPIYDASQVLARKIVETAKGG